MNIKPLADRVLVKPNAAEEKTASGIILPDSAKEKPLKGKVVATLLRVTLATFFGKISSMIARDVRHIAKRRHRA